MILKSTIFVTAIALWCSSASATPLLSGSYAVALRDYCQVIAEVDKDTGVTKFGRDSIEGNEIFSPSTMAFDQTGGTYAWNGISEYVSGVLEQFSDGTKKGHQGKSSSFNENGSYANTDTTLTLDGVLYDVVYGHVDQSGVADSFIAALHLPLPHTAGNHCIISLEAQIQ
jgi:hypothetical protein